MRIRNHAIRTFVLGATAACLCALAGSPEGVAQDAGAPPPPDPTAAVNGASPETERILSELRAGRPGAGGPGTDGPDAEPQPDASAPAAADQADTSPAVPTDGAPEQPPATPISQDGLLRDAVPQQPVDGDLAADGKPIAPPDPVAETIAGAPQPSDVPPGPAASARVPDSETDARAAAGRSRPIVAEDAPAPSPVAPVVADDANTVDTNNLDVPPDAPPVRRAVTDVEADPYAPVGIKRGGFLLLPAITAETLYTDNVRQVSTGAHSDVGIVLRPGLSLQSQWSRHAFTFDLRGALTEWKETPEADTKELHAAMRGRLDISKLSSLEAEAGYDLATVSASSPTLTPGAGGPLPIARTETAGLAYNRTFNRLTLRLHGLVSDTEQGAGDGSSAQRYVDGSIDGRAAYELSPSFTLFGTAKGLQRTYGEASGIDSDGDEVKVGLETDRSVKTSASIDVGAANIRPTHAGGEGMAGVVADAGVTWLPSALTTVTLAASTNILPTNTSGTVAVRTSLASLDVKHQMRRWLALMGGVAVTADEYAGIGLSDVQRTGHLGFEYDISRHWALLGDLQRIDFTSSQAARSYTEDQIRFGLRLQE